MAGKSERVGHYLIRKLGFSAVSEGHSPVETNVKFPDESRPCVTCVKFTDTWHSPVENRRERKLERPGFLAR